MNGKLPNSESDTQDASYPLCVDLDGTLLKIDTLVESFFALLRKNFIFIFLVPVWILHGKAYLKERIAREVTLHVDLLPYNQQFLEFLKAEHKRGRRLVLATAANERIANDVSCHLGLFDEVYV
jgi:FMN phosphatase YigB (HAD superfamily)